jgi:hypothetical protein
MKAEAALIAVGVLLLLLGVYQYRQSYLPPDVTIIPQTTLPPTSSQPNSTFEFRITTTTRYHGGGGMLSTLFGATTSTTKATTTTLIPPSCLNKRLDPDESYVDCGPQCGNCVLMTLDTSWRRYDGENLWLNLDRAERNVIAGGPCPGRMDVYTIKEPGELLYHCAVKSYYLAVQTTETIPDLRELAMNDVEHIDAFELKLIEDNNINSTNTTVDVYVRKNPDTLNITPEYTVLSVGGASCNENYTGFCIRHWKGYSFKVQERSEDRARLEVTTPAGRKLSNLWIGKGNATLIDGASLRLLYPYERGGYCTIFVKEL